MSFDPGEDQATFDGLVTVELWPRDASEPVTVAGALRGPIARQESAPTAGQVLQADVVWHLPVALVAERPPLGSLIVEDSGATWTVLAVELQTLSTRWRCSTRALSIEGEEIEIDLQRPEWAADACGAPVATYTTYATAVTARVTVIDQRAASDQNERAGLRTIRVHLGARLPVEVDDRVLYAGHTLRVLQVAGLERLDRLPELEVEEVR
ncbi:MAG: hypothetical protein K1X74_00560 [Pirellulales bacterium]|nr:hypothetical protein [Pirellulales bacterium]